jgi:predicted RNA-binding protein with PIN domain
MAAEDVPASLRPFQRFTPARRRQVVLPLATALETDEGFRTAVAEGVREALPDLVAAVEAGGEVAAVDPDDVAAVAYLLRAPGWEALVARAAERETAVASSSAAADAARSVEAARRSSAAEIDALRAQVAQLESRLARAAEDVERERRRAREAADRARQAEAALAAATEELPGLRSEVEQARGSAVVARAEATRRMAELEDALGRVRRDTRESREAAGARTWLLLDTLARAVSGLRDELSPAPPDRRPADLVAAELGGDAGLPGGATWPGMAIGADDPGSVDVLLSLPQAHLVVDGYNVTKTGYPDLPLEDQRSRLVSGLAALAARTGAEVTCVFDGAEVQTRVPVAGGSSRRVRVVFSPPGQIADEVIRRLVRAEPTGRPVTVCTADREVIEGVSRSGARVVSPRALLARLGRG